MRCGTDRRRGVVYPHRSKATRLAPPDPNSTVALSAHASDKHVLIEVRDHCGGLVDGTMERMFVAFSHLSGNRSGLGLGLSIARQSVEADFGTLKVRSLPGAGCVFTITLPRHAVD